MDKHKRLQKILDKEQYQTKAILIDVDGVHYKETTETATTEREGVVLNHQMIFIDYELLESLRTDKGGFTKALTDELGVDYPYKKGWKSKLINEDRAVGNKYLMRLIQLSKTLSEDSLRKAGL